MVIIIFFTLSGIGRSGPPRRVSSDLSSFRRKRDLIIHILKLDDVAMQKGKRPERQLAHCPFLSTEGGILETGPILLDFSGAVI